jgi:hypothetical protein
MISGARLLAIWLTPVVWLEMPALVVARGAEGLWVAMLLGLAPLVTLGAASRDPAAREPDAVFPVIVLLLTVGVVLWANLILAGDVAVWLGRPRWHGIALAAAGGWLLIAWRGGWRLVPVLLLVAVLAVTAPVVELARAAGVGPLAAWTRVATQTGFRFPSTSPWVTGVQDLRLVHGREAILFEEEHRLTAPAGGRLLARTLDGGRANDVEWTLAAGQSITLRPGDVLLRDSVTRFRFEAAKRVPGSPPSGIAWAAGRPPDWPQRAGLLVTVLFGALALCRAGAPAPSSRSAVAWVAGGGLVALLWAQGWAIYSLLASPDIFLAGITPGRLLVLPAAGNANPAWPALQASLVAGGVAGFLASSIALRERLGALDRTGGGEIGHDLGLWSGVFAIAALASLWPIDSWSLTLTALGAAASSLGPAALLSGAGRVAATLAGLFGLAGFVALTVTAQLRGGAEGLLGAILAYPALAAVPAAILVLCLCRIVVSR